MKTDEEDEEDAESDDEIQCTTICIFQKKIISYMHCIHCSSYFLEMLPLCDPIYENRKD